MQYKEYNTTLNNLNNYLNEYGVAVIPNVLSEAECINFRNQIWSELKYVTQNRFDVNNQNTWREFFNFYPLHSMLLQHYSLGHMQPIWDIRQHNKVCEPFETIWNTPKNDLLVSFDGLSVHLPPEKTSRGWFLNKEWFHTDQSFKKQNKCCIQGLINLYQVNNKDASLAILEGSNNYHQEFNNQYHLECNDDWYKLKDGEKDFFLNKGCNPFAVKANIGSLVLWDSRTMHQGKEPEKTREQENFRIAVYVCMMPRNTSNGKALEKKQKAFNDLRLTSHWANNPKLFSKSPRTYGGFVPEFNQIHPPQLNNIGRRLAGFD
jgi:hypothetical protein